jgi:uncharacterized protein (TIGR02246 family)
MAVRFAIGHFAENDKSGLSRRLFELNDEQEILKLFEDGDRALITVDVAELARIFADDYVQYDESGKISNKADVMENLRSGKIRFVSMVSTGRRIRMLRDDVAIVHGSEDDVVEQGGRQFPVRYIYLDVVMRRGGRWQIVGSQLARPAPSG